MTCDPPLTSSKSTHYSQYLTQVGHPPSFAEIEGGNSDSGRGPRSRGSIQSAMRMPPVPIFQVSEHGPNPAGDSPLQKASCLPQGKIANSQSRAVHVERIDMGRRAEIAFKCLPQHPHRPSNSSNDSTQAICATSAIPSGRQQIAAREGTSTLIRSYIPLKQGKSRCMRPWIPRRN